MSHFQSRESQQRCFQQQQAAIFSKQALIDSLYTYLPGTKQPTDAVKPHIFLSSWLKTELELKGERTLDLYPSSPRGWQSWSTSITMCQVCVSVSLLFVCPLVNKQCNVALSCVSKYHVIISTRPKPGRNHAFGRVCSWICLSAVNLDTTGPNSLNLFIYHLCSTSHDCGDSQFLTNLFYRRYAIFV